MPPTKLVPTRFTHLKIERWRNFSSAEFDLAQRAFFVGPNASGKSNLLDVFRFLRDIAAVGGGFQAAIERRNGVSAIRSLSARRPPQVVIEIKAGTDSDPDLWSYSLHFDQDNNRRPRILKERVQKKNECLLDRPDSADKRDAARLSQTHIEQINTNQQFRDLADFFSEIRYLHIVPQLIREPGRSYGRKGDPYGGDFLETIATTSPKTRESRLRRITAALKIAVPQLNDLTLKQDTKGFWHLQGRYEHWRPRGAWQTEEQFSDGTLRLLGLLWALLESGGPLLLEKPELSLHPEITRHIPHMFARMQRRSGRQVIVTTHSEALLAEPGIGLDEIHLLTPASEGTTVTTASSLADVKALLEGGMSIGEAVLPKVKPKDARQLSLFDLT